MTASAQDPYALRTAVGSEAYLWELRANQAAKRSLGTPKPYSASAPAAAHGGRTAGRYTPTQGSPMTAHAQSAMRFWGGRQAVATQPAQQRSFVQTASANVPAPASKPFAGADVANTPGVSPYLQLFREEYEEAAPNYHAFVRPQLERRRERQQRQRDVLQARPAPRPTTASTPAAGLHSSRFGNTGSYYGGWQR
ncbi:MAG: hypothetical protein AAGG46_06420 [Planctomycetota bacterium]